MIQKKKVTEEMKEKIISMRRSGSTLVEIGKELGISDSTAAYHSSADYKRKTIARSIKNRKPRNRKDYNREYQSRRYKNDSEFREKTKAANRENQKKKYREKNGTK